MNLGGVTPPHPRGWGEGNSNAAPQTDSITALHIHTYMHIHTASYLSI